MIFVGFGFLMVFLKAHSWSSMGYNMFVAAWSMQFTILIVGFFYCLFHNKWEKI